MHDTLRGAKDKYFDHLVAVTHAGDKEALAKYAMSMTPPTRSLVPESVKVDSQDCNRILFT